MGKLVTRTVSNVAPWPDGAQVALTRFKRDLKNLGMTEAQVHETIPDAPSSSAAPVPASKSASGAVLSGA